MIALIVDDSTTMRQLVGFALRKIEGISVIEAGDGQEALAKLDEVVPDVILTDLNMPIMDGFAFIEKVRERRQLDQIPIIVLTTAGAMQDLERAKTLGVSTYVTKPIRPDDAVSAVLKVTGHAGAG